MICSCSTSDRGGEYPCKICGKERLREDSDVPSIAPADTVVSSGIPSNARGAPTSIAPAASKPSSPPTYSAGQSEPYFSGSFRRIKNRNTKPFRSESEYLTKERKWHSQAEVKVALLAIAITLITLIIYSTSDTARQPIGSFVSEGVNGLGVMGADLRKVIDYILQVINSAPRLVSEIINSVLNF